MKLHLSAGSWPHIFLVYLCALTSVISLGIMGPVAGDIATTFSVTHQDVGLAIAGQLLPIALAGFAVGWAIDKVGVAVALRVVLLAIAATCIANQTVPSFRQLQVSLVVQGLCYVAAMTGVQACLMTTTSGKRQVQAMTLLSTSVPVGFAAGLLMVSSFAGTPAWRTVFLVHAALAMVLFVCTLFLLPSARPVQQQGSVGAGEVFRNVKVWRLGACLGLAALAGMGSNAILPTYLHQALHVDPSASAPMLAMASMAGIAGSIAVGAMLARGWPAMRVTVLVAAVAALGALATFLPNVGWSAVTAGAVLTQLSVGGAITLCLAVLPWLIASPAQSGVAAGLMGQISGIGSAVSAPLFFAALGTGQSTSLAGLVIGAWLVLLVLIPVRRLSATATRAMA